MSNSVLTISDSQFAEEVLNATQTVLVYFWAPWCGPCRLMSPMMDWAANTHSDRLKVVKMEVDPNPEAVSKCAVQGVPALVIFKDGVQVASSEGAIGKPKLEAFLAENL